MSVSRAAVLGIIGLVCIAACATSQQEGVDASTDAVVQDVTHDAVVDAKNEASVDTGTDATTDVIDDQPQDVSVDAMETSVDSGSDVTTDGGGCTSNSDCLTTAYCDKGVGNCAGSGTCLVRPKFCPLLYKPVCGCNKVTYTNSCYAHKAGESEAYAGVCE
jgi:hypothetical protein